MRTILILFYVLIQHFNVLNAQGLTFGPMFRFYFSHHQILKTAGFEVSYYPNSGNGPWLPSVNIGYEHGVLYTCWYSEVQTANVGMKPIPGASMGICGTKFGEGNFNLGFQTTLWAGFIFLGDMRMRIDKSGVLLGGAGSFKLAIPLIQ